jgi:hypothetical protein
MADRTQQRLRITGAELDHHGQKGECDGHLPL